MRKNQKWVTEEEFDHLFETCAEWFFWYYDLMLLTSDGLFGFKVGDTGDAFFENLTEKKRGKAKVRRYTIVEKSCSNQ